jgi:hypothetical protein
MSTGENEQALRKIIDFTRAGSLIILALLFYLSCYGAFVQWHLVHPIADRIMLNVAKIPVFHSRIASKLVVLLLLGVSLIGTKGRPDEELNGKKIATIVVLGLLLFFAAELLMNLQLPIVVKALLYMSITGIGYILVMTGGTLLTRLLKLNLQNDLFNNLAETFPQEEKLITNDYSFNLPARYNLKGIIRNSWINIVNPHRGVLVVGSAGSGKSLCIVNPIIRQSIQSGSAMMLYDFKIPDLSLIAYNTLLKNRQAYKVQPGFYVINFDDLSHSHRCNPIPPDSMPDITDAAESARTIMMGINRDWLKKSGDFFVESPINFLTSLIWFLRKYKGGKYCTLPHVIELSQAPYEELFSVLQSEPTITALINPFISALQHGAAAQLEGQIASCKIGLSRLASPQLYWVLSDSHFSLDLNNPEEPKILCVGNNPLKQQVYAPVLGLYINRINKLINQKNKLKLSYIIDELPTITVLGLDNLLGTARSNKVAVVIALQTYEMLKRDYGQEQAEVIFNLPGNVVSGQTFGETAKQLSERFGKINQARQSKSVNSNDVSVSHSTQLESLIPAAKISNLTAGQFVGLVADNPGQKIEQKIFNSEFVVDFEAIKAEESEYEQLPFVQEVTDTMKDNNFFTIKQQAAQIIADVMDELRSDPGKAHLIIQAD